MRYRFVFAVVAISIVLGFSFAAFAGSRYRFHFVWTCEGAAGEPLRPLDTSLGAATCVNAVGEMSAKSFFIDNVPKPRTDTRCHVHEVFTKVPTTKRCPLLRHTCECSEER